MVGILREKLESAVGRLCEELIPIKHEYHIGQGKSVAVYTSKYGFA